MKKISLILILIFSAVFTFGSTGFALSDGLAALSDGILIIGYRGVTSPRDTGFYYGSDVTLGLPVTVIYSDFTGTYYGFSADDLFLSIKVPLGYRWEGAGRSMGFYLGGSPVMQMVVDWDSGAVYGIGAVAELGWQTIRTEGVGFHFGFQLGLSPIVFSPGNGSLVG